jgi:hypothetical protein
MISFCRSTWKRCFASLMQFSQKRRLNHLACTISAEGKLKVLAGGCSDAAPCMFLLWNSFNTLEQVPGIQGLQIDSIRRVIFMLPCEGAALLACQNVSLLTLLMWSHVRWALTWPKCWFRISRIPNSSSVQSTKIEFRTKIGIVDDFSRSFRKRIGID